MVKMISKALIAASCVTLGTVGLTHAGGLERSGYNIDLLFNPERFAAEATATYVMPDRRLNNVTDSSPWDGPVGGGRTNAVKDSEDYWVPRIGCQSALKRDPLSASKRDPCAGHDGERPTGWSWSKLRNPVGCA